MKKTRLELRLGDGKLHDLIFNEPEIYIKKTLEGMGDYSDLRVVENPNEFKFDWLFESCTHPDHTDDTSCLDRSVGCSKHCLCCMGELAIPKEKT